MSVFGNGTKTGVQRRRAESAESELANLKQAYQRLSDKHVRVSMKYNTLDAMLGWLNDGPSLNAIGGIHTMKAQQLQFKADEEGWHAERRRKENLELMAEAEYDYHVLADPVYRLSNAAEALMKMADYAESNQTSEKINALVMKMKNTGNARTEEHREKFLAERIAELEANVRYVDDLTCEPIVDSIPNANLEKHIEKNEDFKLVEEHQDITKYLIKDNDFSYIPK